MKIHPIWRVSASLLVFLVILSFFFRLPYSGAVHAFNQQNLVRVTGIREVDGRIHYHRTAPVIDLFP